MIWNHWICSKIKIQSLKCQKVPFSICLFHGTPHQAMTCDGRAGHTTETASPAQRKFKINSDPFIPLCGELEGYIVLLSFYHDYSRSIRLKPASDAVEQPHIGVCNTATIYDFCSSSNLWMYLYILQRLQSHRGPNA